MSVASVVVMELCTVIRRYLDIEAAIAGLLALFFSPQASFCSVIRSDL